MADRTDEDPLGLQLSPDWILALRASERMSQGDYPGALLDLNEVIRLGQNAGPYAPWTSA